MIRVYLYPCVLCNGLFIYIYIDNLRVDFIFNLLLQNNYYNRKNVEYLGGEKEKKKREAH